MTERQRVSLAALIREMRSLADPSSLAGMERYGIHTANALGLRVPQLRKIARRLGKDQVLAERLWKTGIHDARILASLVGDPAVIQRSTMDAWTADFDSWDVCDACCCNLFDRTPLAWPMVRRWAKDKREFVRRAAFSIIAAAAFHDKSAPDALFLSALPLLERYAFDSRNYVRKGVNWALRNIGKRNPELRLAAIDCAERIRAQGTSSARWIAADALRELRARTGTRPGK